MVFGIIQLDIGLLAAAVISAVTRLYIKPLRQVHVILVQGFGYHTHSYPYQNKRSTGLDSLIGLGRDDLGLDSADQLVQFEEILHSTVGEWCMIFKLWGLLPSHLSDLSDSLLKPNLLSQLGDGVIIFNSVLNVVQHVHFFLFHSFKDQIFSLHSYGQWQNWVSSLAIRAT